MIISHLSGVSLKWVNYIRIERPVKRRCIRLKLVGLDVAQFEVVSLARRCIIHDQNDVTTLLASVVVLCTKPCAENGPTLSWSLRSQSTRACNAKAFACKALWLLRFAKKVSGSLSDPLAFVVSSTVTLCLFHLRPEYNITTCKNARRTSRTSFAPYLDPCVQYSVMSVRSS